MSGQVNRLSGSALQAMRLQLCLSRSIFIILLMTGLPVSVSGPLSPEGTLFCLLDQGEPVDHFRCNCGYSQLLNTVRGSL
jgi:hypothetical protein